MMRPTGNKTPEGFIFKIMWGNAEFSHSAKKVKAVENQMKMLVEIKDGAEEDARVSFF